MKKKRESPRRALFGGLPPEILEPQMQLVGRREAVIEHCGGVLVYEEHLIKLEFGKLVLQFTGDRLSLKSMTAESVVVCGCFSEISFLEG